jgi:hypothetical protein
MWIYFYCLIIYFLQMKILNNYPEKKPITTRRYAIMLIPVWNYATDRQEKTKHQNTTNSYLNTYYIHVNIKFFFII